METAPPVDGAADCELVYSGPNVMLGYAESAVDLSSGDQLNGTLHTGDLVRRDSEGFFYLTGRLGRFAKLFGRRISLADVETELETAFPVRAAAIEENQRLCVFLEREGDVEPAAVASRLARCLRVPRKFISVSGVAALPLTANGKKDYKALSEGAL